MRTAAYTMGTWIGLAVLSLGAGVILLNEFAVHEESSRRGLDLAPGSGF